MIFFRIAIPFIAFLFSGMLPAKAQSRRVRLTYEEYIDRYKEIAIDHMERYGIPASITMAQGLLESDAGNSWLSKQSNNHFGIKCKRNWTGRKVYHDDDEKGECFRAYDSVEESYRDHAEFLDRGDRYNFLFSLSSDDYKGWARGLKKAGYATAPDYAERLIRIVEENELYLLDRKDGSRLYAARHRRGEDLDSWTSDQTPAISGTQQIDPDNYRVTINAHAGYNIYQTNGVYYILAKDKDTFENIGRRFRLSPRNLRKFNDMDAKAQPMSGETIYIDRKKNRWTGSATHHTCRKGETVFAVSQLYGIRMRAIRRMNHLKRDAVLVENEQIRIQ